MKKMFMIVMVALLGISFMGISSAIAGDCPNGDGTGTPGYWKNHPKAWEPITHIFIGLDSCEKDDCIDLMKGPVKNDKWITLFKAYVAAVLNVEKGNCEPVCNDPEWGHIDLGTAEAWLASNYGTEVRANSSQWQASHGEAEYECLDNYNNGLYPNIAVSRDSLE